MRKGNIVLKNVTVFDGVKEQPEKEKSIVIEEGRIKEILPAAQNFADREVLDLRGAFVSPGFIDCHMHMLLEEVRDKNESLAVTAPGGEQLDTAQAAVAFNGVRNCRRMLDAGFTTVMDGGGNSYIECVMKEAIEKGYFEGPDLYVAGKQLTTNKAHFTGFSMEPFGPYGMRKAIRDLMYHSVDFVKLQLSPPIRMVGRNSQACDFTQEEIDAAVDEAHNYGVPVHAHLRSAAAIQRFLKADGDIVIHGTGIDEESIELMIRKGKYLCATLLSPTPTPSEELVAAKSTPVLELLQKTAVRHWESVKRAYEAGVKIAFSTDANTLGIKCGTNALEFLNLQKIGMSNVEALRSATSIAAEAIGHADTIGHILPGYRANLTILDGNALEDLTATMRVQMTIKDGRIVADHRKATE